MTDGWDAGVQILQTGRPALTHMASTFGDAATNERLLRSMRPALRDSSLNRVGIRHVHNSREELWKEGKDLTVERHVGSTYFITRACGTYESQYSDAGLCQ